MTAMSRTATVLAAEWLPLGKVIERLGKSERSVQRLATAGHLRWKLKEGTRERLYHAGDVERIGEEGLKTHREEAAPQIQRWSTFGPPTVQPLALPPAEPENKPVPKLWLTLEEASACGLGVAALKKLCRDGKITALKTRGEGWRIQRASLEAFAG
jgi:hypothetical protein